MKRITLVIAMLLAACAGILGLTHDGPQAFPHRKHVLAGVSCTHCHVGIGSDDGRALHLPTETTCLECHVKPHDAHPCFACHVAPAAIGELAEAREHLVFDHRTHIARRTATACAAMSESARVTIICGHRWRRASAVTRTKRRATRERATRVTAVSRRL